MKYNDYPLPDSKLIETLSVEYNKSINKVCALSYNEQKAMLNDVYYNIDTSICYLNKLKGFGAKQIDEAIFQSTNNLTELSKLGITQTIKPQVNKKLGQQTCFFEYLKCEVEVLKTLMYLIFLDDLSFNKQPLICIVNTRINIVKQSLE